MDCVNDWNKVSNNFIKGKRIEYSLIFVATFLVTFILYLFSFHKFISSMLIYIMIFITVFFFISLLRLKRLYHSISFKCANKLIFYQSGIVIKNEVIIPCRKVYQTKIRQGPILKKYHLVSLEIITAAGSLEIDYIKHSTAESIIKYIELNGNQEEIKNE